jgi:hypothetical protein
MHLFPQLNICVVGIRAFKRKERERRRLTICMSWSVFHWVGIQAGRSIL